MRKAIVVNSNDWHLKTENLQAITELVVQQCELAKSLGVNVLTCTGDVFESRSSQRLDVLKAFENILDIVYDRGMILHCIPGNHDKTVYSSKESFLDPYKHHPGIMLYDELSPGIVNGVDGMTFMFLPYFSEPDYIERLDSVKCKRGDRVVLFTHVGITGSINNDLTLVENGLKVNMFDKFYKVFSGHYHDPQQIGKNFFHTPAITQKDFGENTEKGFVVLYDDMSHDIVFSKFKKFLKIKIDLDKLNEEDVATLVRFHKNSDSNVRFEFIGSENMVKAVDREELAEYGIDFKAKIKEIEVDIEYCENNETTMFTKASILSEFTTFCAKEDLNEEEGLVFLNRKL